MPFTYKLPENPTANENMFHDWLQDSQALENHPDYKYLDQHHPTHVLNIRDTGGEEFDPQHALHEHIRDLWEPVINRLLHDYSQEHLNEIQNHSMAVQRGYPYTYAESSYAGQPENMDDETYTRGRHIRYLTDHIYNILGHGKANTPFIENLKNAAPEHARHAISVVFPRESYGSWSGYLQNLSSKANNNLINLVSNLLHPKQMSLNTRKFYTSIIKHRMY
jgi:hypothetical protein